MQLHNVHKKSLKCKTGELIGKSIDMVVKVADLKDNGTGGEFLRVRVTLDISKLLPRCSKLKLEGRQLGWVGIKYNDYLIFAIVVVVLLMMNVTAKNGFRVKRICGKMTSYMGSG